MLYFRRNDCNSGIQDNNPGFLRGPGDDAGGLCVPGYAQLHVDQTQLTELAGCRFGTNKL